MFEHFMPWRGNKRSKQSRGAKPSGSNHRLSVGRSSYPVFELLEMRAMLSAVSVTDLNDDGSSNSLRAAMNAATAGETINLSTGVYSLTQGELIADVTGSLTIVGQGSSGPNATIIDQLSLDRVFQIAAGASVTFKNVQITGGVAITDDQRGTTAAQGGGILNAGTLTLDNVTVSGNKALATVLDEPAMGGGVYSTGVLTVQNGSVIQGNGAIGMDGSDNSQTSNASGYGGGIFSLSSGQLTVTGSTIADNAAIGGSGGTGDEGFSGLGGGVYISNTSASPSLFNNDIITGNRAVGGAGGGLNASGGFGVGGAIEVDKGGGNVDTTGSPVTITNTLLAYNVAQGGVGGTATGGDAYGGAIDFFSGGSLMVNDTVYGNMAMGGTGATSGNAFGGGIEDDSAYDPNPGHDTVVGGLSIINVTVASNSAKGGGTGGGQGRGGGIENDHLNPDADLVVKNTLDAGNTADLGIDFFGAVATADDNLIGDDTGNTETGGDASLRTAGSQVGPGTGAPGALPINPKLGLPQNNGGSAQTAALLAGSSAIDAGDSAAASAALTAAGLSSTDQRGTGFSRIVGAKVDIGAFEVQSSAATSTVLSAVTSPINVGQSVTFTATVSGTGTPTGTVTFEDTINGTTTNLGTATLSGGVATFQVLSLPAGTNSITAVYSGSTAFSGSSSAARSVVVNLASGLALAASATALDGSSGSLRAAIVAANANTGTTGETIVLSSGTYALTLGQLSITNTNGTLTIIGQGSSGPNATIIDQLSLDRVMQIASGASVTLENVEITGGIADTDDQGLTSNANLGGGILDGGNPGVANAGVLTLTNVAVETNKSVALTVSGVSAYGGGILTTGTLNINGSAAGSSLIVGNSCIATDGASGTGASGGSGGGGGIFWISNGSATISGATITGNAVLAGFGGDSSSTAGGNGGQASGGGIALGGNGTLTVELDNDTISGNVVRAGDGGAGGAASANGIGGPASGGGIDDESSTALTLNNDTITNNKATGGRGFANPFVNGNGASGGGINVASGGVFQLNSSTVSGNTAQGGAGDNTANGATVQNPNDPTNSQDVTSDSGAGGNADGGGISLNYGGSATSALNNNVITGNTALGGLGGLGRSSAAGGTGGQAFAGGVFSNGTGAVQVNGSTISTNSSQAGAGGKGGSGGAGGAGGTGVAGGAYLTNNGANPISVSDDTIANNVVNGGVGGVGGTGGASTDGGAGGEVFGGGLVMAEGSQAFQSSVTTSQISGNTAQGGAGGAASGGKVGAGGNASAGGFSTGAAGTALANDTIYGNTATGGTGFVGGNAVGGGIEDVTNGTTTGATILNVTVVANTVKAGAATAGGTAGTATGGGIVNDGSFGAQDSALAVGNTLVAQNKALNSSGTNVEANGPDFFGKANVSDDNFIGDGTGSIGLAVSGNIVGPTSGSPINPVIGPLQNNGGNNETVALLAGSPALGVGDPAAVSSSGLTTDQRGLPRVVSGKVDIGAFETQGGITAPLVTPSGNTQTFVIGGAAVAVDSGITVGSNDTDLTGATMTISSGTLQSGDTLHFTNQNGITGSFSAGKLTLTGSATPAQYQAALRSVTFSTTSTNTTARSIAVVAIDNSLTSTSVAESVTVAVSAPVVTPSGTTNTFNVGGAAVAVDSGITVSSNDTDLTGATVTISPATLQSGDTLHFTNQNGITGSFSAGTLTLSGSATPAQYQTALRSVTFSTTSSNITTRAISAAALDNSLTSTAAAESVKVVLAPGVTASGTTNTFNLGGAAVAVDSGVTVSSSDTDLTGATVTISQATLQSGDTLHFTNQNGITGSFSAGTLTLSGSATPAQYQTALRSVTFSTTSTNTTTRAISIVAVDNALTSTSAAESVKVAIAAPVVTASATTNTFTFGGTAVAVDSGVTVTSADTNLTGAKVTISSGTLQAGDTLHFTNQNGITGSFSGGVLTLSGSATPAQYQTALQSVTFSTTSVSPVTRSLTIVALDNAITSNSVSKSVKIIAPPVAVASGTTNTFFIAGSAVAVDSGMTVSSNDTHLTGATVTISPATLQSGDTLHFTNQNGITGSFAAGTLTLSGSATPAQYQTALQSVTFSTTSTNTTARAIAVVASDNTLVSTSVAESVKVSFAAPVVTPSNGNNTFTVGSTAVPVDSGVTVTSDESHLTGATLTISSATLQSGDTLHFTNQNGISGTFAAGTLTLSGSATPAQYQTALQSVTFSTTSNSTVIRALTIVALDNSTPSNSVAKSITVIGAPVVAASGSTNTFTIGGSAVAVDLGLTVSSNDTDLTGATVTISPATLQSGDTLHFTNQNGITGSFSAGTLTLSGSATPAQYQTALRSVTFSTSSIDTTTRSIAVVALDNTLASDTAAESVKVLFAPPLLTPSGTINTFTSGGAAVAVDANVSVSSADPNLSGATVTISPATLQSGDTLHFTNQNGITGSFSGGVLTLSGTATLVQYQTALRSITFSTTSNSPVTRSLSIVALDSSATGPSDPISESVKVIVAPVVTASGTTNTFTVGGAAVAVDSGLTVTSNDTNLTGATLTISSATLQSGDTLNFTSQNGITGSFAAGTLTLSGSATVAQYQTALGSVTFSTTSTNATTRAIAVVALDNSLASNSVAESMKVIAATASLSGTAYQDINQDGHFVDGEATLDNVVVTLTGTDSNGQAVSRTFRTGMDGTYTFLNLVSGTYSLSASFPTDLTPGTATAGNVSGTAAGEKISAITLAAGATGTGYNFGASGMTPQFITLDLFLASTPTNAELLNQEPGISSLSVQTVNSGQSTPAIPFTVNDTLVPAASLTATGTSSDTTLVPNANIVFAGTGASRTLTVTPAAGQAGTATITVTVADPYGNQTAVTFTLNVLSTAVVTPSGTINTFRVGGAAVSVDSGVTVTSDGADLTGATVAISAGTLQSGDTLNFTNQNGITGSFSGGVLTLSGSATVANYQTALQSITFSTTSNSPATRSITIVALDNSAGSNAATESVKIIAAPVVTASGTTNTFTIGDAGVTVDAGLAVSSNDTGLTGATVTISPATLQSGDTLNFANQNGITGSFAAGTLTLTGSATPAQYQTALQSVTFSTTSTNTATRAISVVAIDSSLISTSAVESVKVSFAAPVVTASDVTDTFTVGGAAVAVDAGVTVSSSDPNLTGAKVTISSGTLQSGDTLNFTNQNGITGSFTAGTLTLSGNATPAQYQTALQSVSFSTTSDSPVTRSLTIVALDSALTSNSVTKSVNVIAPPIVTASGATNTFTDAGAPVAVDAGVTVTSNDANLTGAKVAISAGTLQSGDTLNFTNQNGITGAFAAGTLTLSGSATLAQYQAALRSITFSTTSNSPVTRSLTIVALDNAQTSNSVAESIKVIAAAVVTPSGTTNTFTVGGSAVAVDAGVAVSSNDTDLTGATVTISPATLQSGDTLHFTNQNGITGTFAAGVLTLSGSATPAQYQTALQSVTFSTTSVNTADRAISVVALDNALASASAAETVKVAIAAPVVTSSGTTNTFTVGGAAVAVDAGLMVSSLDANLTGAKVTISSGTLQSGDTLNFTNQNGIIGSFAAGVLTLTGSATPAQYQAALQSVVFSTTSTSTTTRALSVVALDNALTSNSAAENVQVAIAAPVVTPSGTTNTFTVGGAEAIIDSGLTVSSFDTNLTGAKITISSGTLQSGDTLNFIDQNGITGSYSGGVLTLSGTDTVANYQMALQTVTFSSTSTNTTTRTISIVALDNSLVSAPAAESIDVVIAPPFVIPSGAISNFLVGGAAVAVDSGVVVTSGDNNLTSVTLTISADTLKTGDTLHFTNQNGITGSFSAGVLTLSGSATPDQYQAALQSVTFSTTSTDTTTRAISIVAFDNTLTSSPADESIAIITAPVLTPSGNTSTFTIGGSAVAVDSAVTVSSNDTNLTGAKLTISSGTLQSGDTLNFTNQNGITGSFSGGVLTLSGSASVGDYETALRSVTFSSTSTSTTARAISVVALDSSLTSSPAAESVNVTFAPPVVTPSGATATYTIGGSAVAVDSAVTVGSSDTDLTGATVTISSGTLQSGDSLNFTDQNGIVGHLSGGVLTLSGNATVANYQAALRSITFSTTSTDMTTRAISIVAFDNALTSNSAAESVEIAAAAPVVMMASTWQSATDAALAGEDDWTS